MANYVPYQQSDYSLLDNPQFQSYFSGKDAGVESQSGLPQKAATSQDLVSPSTARAAANGAQFGGASGALISGGVSSMLTNGAGAGGPYALAGGLILSQIEAAQKAKAQQEAERVQNEKDTMEKTRQSYMNNANMRFGV